MPDPIDAIRESEHESFGTPPNLVFDDEPVEALLYGEGAGPTSANIFEQAIEAWFEIRKALKSHEPERALQISEPLVRDGRDIPSEMLDEFAPIWRLLGPDPSSTAAEVQPDKPCGVRHLAILFDFAFHDFVHRKTDRCRMEWQTIAEICKAESGFEDDLNQTAQQAAFWWWQEDRGCFLGATQSLSEAEGGAAILAALLRLDISTVECILKQLDKYRLARRHADFRTMFEQVISASAIAEAAGADHPVVASCFSPLVRVLQAEGEYESAIAITKAGLRIREEAIGPDHPDTIAQFDNLAELLFINGDLLGAEKYYREALSKRERIFGHKDPATLQSATNLAEVLEELQNYEESGRLREQATAILERVSGPVTSEILTDWNNYSCKLRQGGWPSVAESIDRQIVPQTIEHLGESHPLAIHRRNNLVLSLLMTGKIGEAADCLATNSATETPTVWQTKPRVCYLQVILAMISGQSPGLPLRDLKRFLTGSNLPEFSGISIPWDVDYFIRALRRKLPAASFDLIKAIAEVIKYPVGTRDGEITGLERFDAWREAGPPPPIGLDDDEYDEDEEDDDDDEDEEDEDGDNGEGTYGSVKSISTDRLVLIESGEGGEGGVEQDYAITEDTEYANITSIQELSEGDDVFVYFVEVLGERTIQFIAKA